METPIMNRNTAYHGIIENLPEKRGLVLQLISENKGITTQEISEKYFLPINEVSGRISELTKMCLIRSIGSRENRHTGYLNTVYQAITNKTLVVNLRNQKAQELIDKRDSLVNDYLLGMSELGKGILELEKRKIEKELRWVY